MNTDDDARCEEIERRLKAGRKYGDEVEWAIQAASDLRFLIDLARTADAMLRDAFLSHGLDVDALLAEAEKRAAMKCRGMCMEKALLEYSRRSYDAASAGKAADAITAAYNLPPLEETT